MALEQAAESTDQELTFLEDVAPLLDGAMHGEEAVDEVGIEKYVPREVRYLFDTKPVGHLIERRLGEVERPITPTLAAAHPTGVRLGGGEREQRPRLRPPHLTPALAHRTALTGCVANH